MAEIIIANPEINRDRLRAHAYQSRVSDINKDSFRISLAGLGITPDSHSNVVDLCAGDGGMARILVDLGWDESRILCVDRCVSSTPLVEKAKWVYWDLEELGRALILGRAIPEEIERYRERFDITFLVNGLTNEYYAKEVMNFFSKPNSLMIPSH